MCDIVEHKKQLRRHIKLLKSNLSETDLTIKSNKVFECIELLPNFQSAKCVLAFWSLPDEISTHAFVTKWASQKLLLLPVMVGQDLEIRVFNGIETLSNDNSFHVMEPKTTEAINPEKVDFAIIPGVAFDKLGNRLGRGKGFYDRLMPQLVNAYKVGVGYQFQLLESIPISNFDVPVDEVICK